MPINNLSGSVVNAGNQDYNTAMGEINELEGLGKTAIKLAAAKKAAIKTATPKTASWLSKLLPKTAAPKAAVKAATTKVAPFMSKLLPKTATKAAAKAATTKIAPFLSRLLPKTATAQAKPALTTKVSVAGRKSIAVSTAKPKVVASKSTQAARKVGAPLGSDKGVIAKAMTTQTKRAVKVVAAPAKTTWASLFAKKETPKVALAKAVSDKAKADNALNRNFDVNGWPLL